MMTPPEHHHAAAKQSLGEIDSTVRKAFFRGKRNLALGALGRARESFELAVRGAPDNGCYRAYLAWSRFLEDPSPQRQDDARTELERALDTAEGHEMAACFLGRLALKARDVDAAREFFCVALRANSANQDARTGLHQCRSRDAEARRNRRGLLRFFKR